MRKYGIVLKNSEKILKKFSELYEKKINNFCLLQFFCKVIVSRLNKKLLKTNLRQFLIINILLTIAKIAKW